jgi:hypothetical protein
MGKMFKRVASIIVLLVAGGLLIYSASRTLSLLQMTLPAGQRDVAFLALLAFDGGLVAWLLVFMFAAEGGWQRAIAASMVVVDLVGVVIGFGADSLIGASNNGMVSLDKSIALTAILLTTGIIAANIAATVFFHMLSPENRRRMAQETARDKIEAASLKAIEEHANVLAAEIAPMVAASWVRDMQTAYTSGLSVESRTALPAPERVPAMVTMASEGVELPAKKALKRGKRG